ncbi:MAG: lipase family protein [Clostridia bacterium]|nr:lipase family protein [Clostridia bacterium]
MDLYELFSICLSVPYSQAGLSANYAIKRDKQTLYLFFEGSNGARDWVKNLNFPAKAYKRMGKTVWFAHRGFLRAWKELEPTLEDEIADKSVQKIVISGYSHGAAIALLCHEYVWFHRPELRNSLEGYGFGCPRVIWGVKGPAFKKRWEKFTVIRNIDDLVTHLPPAFLGYSHVGTLLKIGKRGNYSPVEAHLPENIHRELLLAQKNEADAYGGRLRLNTK